jgi:hypothetical protein
MKHHIWCNFQIDDPEVGAEDCEMCSGLKQDYPEKLDDPQGRKLLKEHFPNAKPIGHPNE